MRLRHPALVLPTLVALSLGSPSRALAQGTAATAVVPAVSALPDDRLGIRTVPLLLLTRADVRAEVKLSPEQIASANAAITDLHVRAAATKGMTGAQARSVRKTIDDAQAAWIREHLTADQLARLSQIDLQWEGPSALVSRPVVSDTLGLTEVQRASLAAAVSRRDAARKLQTNSQDDERLLAESALALLTAPQKARWRVILGVPFTPQLAAQNPPTRR